MLHAFQKKSKSARPPSLIHREAKLTSGIIRDVFTDKVDSLIIDNKDVFADIGISDDQSRILAEAIQTRLTERGVAAERLEARGFGESRPVYQPSGHSPASRNIGARLKR
mgnify:CR=1 FL=1